MNGHRYVERGISQDDVMHEGLVTVETFSDPSQAELAQQRLEQAGIPAYLKGAATTGESVEPGGSFSTIKLQVREDDLERARELLASPPPQTRANPSEAPPARKMRPTTTASRNRTSIRPRRSRLGRGGRRSSG
jgi:hypothetical protein